jgi:hypothetical protein
VYDLPGRIDALCSVLPGEKCPAIPWVSRLVLFFGSEATKSACH